MKQSISPGHDVPLVSVVIPAHDAELYIGQTLASALEQTYRNLEVIVIDDGSSDRTAAIVQEIARRDRRLRLIQTENRGVAAARNTGIAASTGSYIAMLDADDLWHPQKIARQMEVFRRSERPLGLVYCFTREVDAAGRILSTWTFPPYEGDVYSVLVLVNFVGGGSCALIDRSSLVSVGGFDSQRHLGPAADTKLFLRIAEQYDFGVAPQYLVGYRRTATSMSQNVSEMFRSQEAVLLEARSRHPELPPRLFRWARSENALWLASECVSRHRFRLGAVMLFRAALRDPCGTASIGLGLLRHTLAPFFISTHRTLAPRFADVTPDFGVRSSRQGAENDLRRRRQAIAASWRLNTRTRT